MSKETVTLGPFTGYVSNVPKQLVPPTAVSGDSQDAAFDPFTGSFTQRLGMTIQRDTFSGGDSVSGILESKWGAVNRKMVTFDSPSLTDGYPTTATLFAKDSNSASFPATDSGWWGSLYVSNTNQAGASGNYQLLTEYSSTHYPANAAAYTTCDYVVVPYWYESGEGGYARGVNDIQRRYVASGSRSLLQAQESLYLPNLRGTPLQWFEKRFNDSTSTGSQKIRVKPTGPMPIVGKVTITTPGAVAGGTWADGDTFYLSVIPIYKDGSRGQPQLVRPPNATLTTGYQMLTVGTPGGANAYTTVTYTIPKGSADVVAREIWRSTKQKRAATTDVLTINPNDLRYVGTLFNNSQTQYVDSFGTDASLTQDVTGTRYRFDLSVPRRARHIGTADQRALISYTLPSPCGIILAPYGVSADGDLNLMDDEAIGSSVFLYRITTSALELNYWDGALHTTSITLNSSTALQDVVDQINATAHGGSGKQWVASVAPGVDITTVSTKLCPTTWDVASVTSDGTTTLTVGSGFTNIPIGYEVYDPAGKVPAGAYVASKTDDGHIVMSAAVPANAGRTLTFYANTGDGTGYHATQRGYIRAFAPSYPGHAYLRRSAVTGYDRPDRQSIYFTVSSPGAANTGSSLAPGMFGVANRRTPPSYIGPCMGIVDVESAAIVGYARGMRYFVNVRGVNSGEDFDYRVMTLNDHRGVTDEKAFVGANGWAFYPTFEGLVACDKSQTEKILSHSIFNYATGSGDLAYELTQGRLAASGDTDGGRMYAAVLGTQVHVAFRQSAGAGTVPDTRLVYDFGPGVDAGGITQLTPVRSVSDSYSVDPNSNVFGWSTRYVQPGGAMAEVPQLGGVKRYCAISSNAGTNDGRIDLMDSGNSDNGTAITCKVYPAPLVAAPFELLSVLRVEVHHANATGPTAVVSLVGYRTINRVSTQSYPLAQSADSWLKTVFPLGTDMGTNTDFAEFLYSGQSTTAQSFRIWRLMVELERVPTF